MHNFEEEKEFHRTKGSSIGGPWGRMYANHSVEIFGGIDQDIYSFLIMLNICPFMYSAGMSCSGSLKDHQGELIAHNYRFGVNTQTPQGYCVIRADTSNNDWKKIKDLLLAAPNSQITSSVDWERQDCACYEEFPVKDSRGLFAYQIFTSKANMGTEITQIWRNLTLNLVEIVQSAKWD